jgi:hypothetical protein
VAQETHRLIVENILKEENILVLNLIETGLKKVLIKNIYEFDSLHPELEILDEESRNLIEVKGLVY